MNIASFTPGDQTHIQHYQPGTLTVNKRPYTHNLILTPDTAPRIWPVDDIYSLKADHIAPLIDLNADVILLGTGEKLIFPEATALAPAYQKGLNIEIMNTYAASKTFNILVSEGRYVIAALIV